MAVPSSRESRLFYRCAKLRYEEAQILLKNEKPTGAVYLAGYSVECMLKSLILASVPEDQAVSILGSFRGNRAHEYEWLRAEYRTRSGRVFPGEINRRFAQVDVWSTDLRYNPGTYRTRDAESFLEAAKVIIDWIDGRL